MDLPPLELKAPEQSPTAHRAAELEPSDGFGIALSQKIHLDRALTEIRLSFCAMR